MHSTASMRARWAPPPIDRRARLFLRSLCCRRPGSFPPGGSHPLLGRHKPGLSTRWIRGSGRTQCRLNSWVDARVTPNEAAEKVADAMFGANMAYVHRPQKRDSAAYAILRGQFSHPIRHGVQEGFSRSFTFEVEPQTKTCRALSAPPARRRRLAFRHEAHCPGGGCQSSTLFPSGSITQPNFPYSESSAFFRTLHPSSRSN